VLRGVVEQPPPKTYRKLEGQHVEALGVLVGLVSGSEVHVVYMVRAFTPVPGTP
jgi:hypothetical protein